MLNTQVQWVAILVLPNNSGIHLHLLEKYNLGHFMVSTSFDYYSVLHRTLRISAALQSYAYSVITCLTYLNPSDYTNYVIHAKHNMHGRKNWQLHLAFHVFP